MSSIPLPILRKNKIHFTSLGCARNLVDSEVMLGLTLRAGYEVTDQKNGADVLVINTCGFLEASRQEALDTIAEVFAEKQIGAKVVVTGCMVQKHKDLLKERFPHIHAFVGTGDVEKIVDAIEGEAANEQMGSAKSYLEWGEVPRMLSTPQHYAYLKIAEGCLKACSFCAIPKLKGPLRSKPQEQVLKEFQWMIDRGVKEIILIAQDLGDYGKERKQKNALETLLAEMLKVPGDYWIRLLYVYPDEISEELIALMKKEQRLCRYLDMPIQHVSDPLLKAMRRKTNKEHLVTTIRRLRAELPDIVLRTSLMVGFPGETEAQFEELCTFVETEGFDYLGIFSYSRERLSSSYNYVDQVDEETKQRRHETLALVQQKSMVKRFSRFIGQKVKAIVESPHPDSPHLARARFYGQCPDIDGEMIINDVRKISRYGAFYEVKISDMVGYDLVGQIQKPLFIPTSSP